MAAPSNMTGKSQTANATPDRYMPLRALEVRDYTMQWYDLLPHVKVPNGNSDTVTFHRWPHLALPTAELAEGDNGTPLQLSSERVTCVLQTHGAHVKVSSLSEKITIGSPMAVASDRLGTQQARVVDREITRQAMGATTKYYPGAITARSGIGASDVITSALMKKVRARLRRAGAPAYQGNKFVMVTGPEVAADMQNDELFLKAAAYQKFDLLVSGELGEWHGFRIVEANTTPYYVLLSTTNATLGAANQGAGETVLTDATYYVIMTANDSDGFETGFYAGQSQAIADSGDGVLTIGTPALPTGYVSFNLYVGTSSAYTDCALQVEKAAASTTYRINGNAGGTNGVAYATTGRIVGVAPASGVTVHPIWFLGAEFMKCTELSQVQWHRVTTPDSNNPLLRYMSVGWVLEGFRALITDQTFGGCIEVATLN